MKFSVLIITSNLSSKIKKYPEVKLLFIKLKTMRLEKKYIIWDIYEGKRPYLNLNLLIEYSNILYNDRNIQPFANFLV